MGEALCRAVASLKNGPLRPTFMGSHCQCWHPLCSSKRRLRYFLSAKTKAQIVMQFSTMVWLARSYGRLQRAADSLDLVHFATLVGVQRRRTSRVFPGIGLAFLGAAGGAGAALLFAPSSGAALRARLLGAPKFDTSASDVSAPVPAAGAALESPPGAALESDDEVAPRVVPESMIVLRGTPDPLEVDLLEGVFMGASDNGLALPTVQCSVRMPPATGADDAEVAGAEDVVLNWMSRATQAGHSLSESDLETDPDNIAELPNEQELEDEELDEEVWPVAERARSRA
jgi:hypothetical protein